MYICIHTPDSDTVRNLPSTPMVIEKPSTAKMKGSVPDRTSSGVTSSEFYFHPRYQRAQVRRGRERTSYKTRTTPNSHPRALTFDSAKDLALHPCKNFQAIKIYVENPFQICILNDHAEVFDWVRVLADGTCQALQGTGFGGFRISTAGNGRWGCVAGENVE